MEKTLLNAVVRLPAEMVTQLQDECEEFRFDLDELISLTLIAAISGNIDSGVGCLYEKINWKGMKEQGLCE
jgi:hypothetical protein